MGRIIKKLVGRVVTGGEMTSVHFMLVIAFDSFQVLKAKLKVAYLNCIYSTMKANLKISYLHKIFIEIYKCDILFVFIAVDNNSTRLGSKTVTTRPTLPYARVLLDKTDYNYISQ